MTRVTIHAAKTTLSKLIERVEAGEEVVIARGSTPVARLVAVKPTAQRRPGSLKGLVSIDEGFFEALPDDEVSAWDGP